MRAGHRSSNHEPAQTVDERPGRTRGVARSCHRQGPPGSMQCAWPRPVWTDVSSGPPPNRMSATVWRFVSAPSSAHDAVRVVARTEAAHQSKWVICGRCGQWEGTGHRTNGVARAAQRHGPPPLRFGQSLRPISPVVPRRTGRSPQGQPANRRVLDYRDGASLICLVQVPDTPKPERGQGEGVVLELPVAGPDDAVGTGRRCGRFVACPGHRNIPGTSAAGRGTRCPQTSSDPRHQLSKTPDAEQPDSQRVGFWLSSGHHCLARCLADPSGPRECQDAGQPAPGTRPRRQVIFSFALVAVACRLPAASVARQTMK